MRINDKDVKEMVTKVDSIYVDVAVIKEHLKTINGRCLTEIKHSANIDDSLENIKIKQTDLRAKIWVLFALCAGAGSIIGAIVSMLVKHLLGF